MFPGHVLKPGFHTASAPFRTSTTVTSNVSIGAERRLSAFGVQIGASGRSPEPARWRFRPITKADVHGIWYSIDD